jgi:hypothetical protein
MLAFTSPSPRKWAGDIIEGGTAMNWILNLSHRGVIYGTTADHTEISPESNPILNIFGVEGRHFFFGKAAVVDAHFVN